MKDSAIVLHLLLLCVVLFFASLGVDATFGAVAQLLFMPVGWGFGWLNGVRIASGARR